MKNKLAKTLLVGMTVISCLGMSTTVMADAQVLTLAQHNSKESTNGQATQVFVDYVNENSDTIQIQPYYNGELGGIQEAVEGVVMGTRSGSIDPAIVEYIAKKENLDIEGVMNVLNKKSGVQGMTGISSDFRDLEAAYNEGNEYAINAIEVFCYRVAKYIGSYVAAMNGVDAIAFTAGIGENNIKMRKDVCSSLTYLGVKLDEEKNNVRGEERIISADDSKVQVLLVPTNEELAIARETLALVK